MRPDSPHAAEAAFQLARDQARRARQRRSVRGGGRPLPGHAVGRGGARSRSRTTTRRTPSTTRRCPGGGDWSPSTRRAATSRERRGARDGATIAPAATRTPRSASRRRHGCARPAGRPPGFSTGPPAPGWPWARPTAPGSSSRRRSSATSTPTTGFARPRSSPGSVAARRRGRCSWPRRRPRTRRSPSRARAASASCCSSTASPEAAAELRLLPESPRVQATLAWADWRQGRYRPAITAMKRAYPEWVGEAGDRLPSEVWQILFPLRYDRELRLAAQEEGVDPALVAALILQESSFDAGALSRAGARGLMQVMPATGRTIARAKGQRFRRAALHRPGDEPRLRHALPAADERAVLRRGREGPRRLQRGPAPRGRLDGAARRAQPRGVHREHPLQRDPHLRHDRARQPRAVPPAVRAGPHDARRPPRREHALELSSRRLQAADRPLGPQARAGRARGRPLSRPAAPRPLHHRLPQARRRLLPRRGRRHPRACAR